MPKPRKELISLNDTPFYHCVSRCVRRAFLCGNDPYSGKCYEHRRDWLESKLLFVADVFAIKVCAYVIMSNHYHVVLHVRPEVAKGRSKLEVVTRWHTLFSGSLLSARFLKGETLSKPEMSLLNRHIRLWRTRLMDISWLMRVVNESIARQANAEDECTGHFWESRFKSQALLDEQALLSCMAYVDLNPIRAKMAKTPENSDFTSIQKRIVSLTKDKSLPKCLELFTGINKDSDGIPYRLKDYIELVEWTGRIIHPTKRGFISDKTPSLLPRLNLAPDTWELLTTQFEAQFSHFVSSEQIVQTLYKAQAHHPPPS